MTCMEAIFSALEQAKGFTRPIQPGTEPKFGPDEVIIDRDTLMENN